MVPEEEARRLAMQGADEAILQLVADSGAEDRDRPGPNDRDRRLQQHDEGEADRQHPDQPAVGAAQGTVDRELHLQRHDQDQRLSQDRAARRPGRTSGRHCESGDRYARSETFGRARPAFCHAGETRVSSATPVNDGRRRPGTAIRPAAGSMMTIPVLVTRSRTTKWFISQCRIAGSASCARPSTRP